MFSEALLGVNTFLQKHPLSVQMVIFIDEDIYHISTDIHIHENSYIDLDQL